MQPLTAEVTLLIERNHPVPVMIQRNGLRAVMYGMGGQAEIRHIAAHADVQVGDMLVTSGIDGVYPAGLPVAKVASRWTATAARRLPALSAPHWPAWAKTARCWCSTKPEPARLAGSGARAQDQIPPQTWK